MIFPEQPRPKVRRVRTGCITCRARKVKCDETAGGCKNCKHRQLICDYITSAGGSVDVTASSFPNPRQRPACQECRTARCKCSQSRPRCTRCSLKMLKCIYPETRDGHRVGLTPLARAKVAAVKQREWKSTLAGSERQDDEVSSAKGPVGDRHGEGEGRHVEAPIDPEQGGDRRSVPSMVYLNQAEILPSSNSPYRPYFVPFDHLPRDDHSQESVSLSNSTIQGDSLSALPTNLQHHIDAFFDYVAPYQANGFLHRGTLKQQIRDGRACEILLLAICAITARFLPCRSTSTSQPPNLQASQWAQLATQRLMSSPDITLKNAIAALILCKNASYNGAFNQGFLLAALANRYALKLGLFDESRWAKSGEPEVRWVWKEQRRRIMFACYCVDRMTATGMKELTFCPAESMNVQLPCEDYNYDLEIPCATPTLMFEGDELASGGPGYDAVGIMGHYVSIVGIRYVILRYIESLSRPDPTPPWKLESDYHLSLRKLSQWSTNLPLRLQLSRENIFGRHHTPHLGPLVILHLWFDMLHCELYLLALQTHSEPQMQALFLTAPPGWIDQTQDLCVYHACNMVKTLKRVEDDLGDEGLTILDPSLAMMCYASMKIQLLYSSARDPLGLERGQAGDETVERFQMLLVFVERLSRYFGPAALLLKEMERTLQRSGVTGPWDELAIATSGTQMPDHPWLARLKRLDQQTPPDLSGADDDIGLFDNILPDVDMSFFNQLR